MPLIENFKKFLEKQKQIRDENAHEHFYINPILEVNNSIEDDLKVKLNKVDIELQKNAKAIEVLKCNTNKLLNNGELVFRVSRLDLPISNNTELVAQNNFINSHTHQYFMEMVDNFKKQMIDYSDQIQTLKSYCSTSDDLSFSFEELNSIIRKQHENFVVLASKVYSIHEYANKLRSDAERLDENKSLAENINDSKSLQNNNKHGPSPFFTRLNPATNLKSKTNSTKENDAPLNQTMRGFSSFQNDFPLIKRA